MSSPVAENRYAFLTGAGKAAIGVAWFGGPGAVELLQRCFRTSAKTRLSLSPAGAIVYGRWRFFESGETIEEDVVVLKRGPVDYEVHVHGGEQSRACLRRSFEATGFVELPSNDWLRRQSACGLSAAVMSELLHCQTERAARLLLGQEQAWKDALQSLHQLIKHQDGGQLARYAGEILSRKRLAEHLTKPWRVVLAGLPNVGKSSLINAICGFERAIVHNAPGTTRDVVTQQVVIDGWLFEIADTAGQRTAEGEIEQAGIERAQRVWQDADCRVEVRDASRRTGEVEFAIDPMADLVVANKVDLPEAEPQASELPVSARTGEGLRQLQAALVQHILPEGCSPNGPLPIAEPMIESLAELQQAGEGSDWSIAAGAFMRLAEFCGQQAV